MPFALPVYCPTCKFPLPHRLVTYDREAKPISRCEDPCHEGQRSHRMVHWGTHVPADPDYFTCHQCGARTGKIVERLDGGDLKVEWLASEHVCSPRQLRDSANGPWND